MLITTEQIGAANDQNRVVYFDLPLPRNNKEAEATTPSCSSATPE
jgi:hypothetical protein